MARSNKISVIVPLYNKEKFIKKTIKSVLSQTHKNFEIIIVDDGSIDNSLNIVSSFNDERITIITKENGGVSEARNVGIEVANYDYIAFLDADDVWDELFLEEINKLINEFPQASVFGTGYRFEGRDKNRKVPKNIKKLKRKGRHIVQDYFKSSFEQPLLTSSSITIQKSIFEEIGMFKPYLNRGEDLEMWSRIALDYKIAFTPKILATYFYDISDRKKDTSLITEQTFSYYATQFYEKHKDKAKINGHSNFKRYMYRVNLTKSLNYIKIKDKKSAIMTLFPLRLYYLVNSRFWKNLLLLLC